jgi:Right handed beta helix region
VLSDDSKYEVTAVMKKILLILITYASAYAQSGLGKSTFTCVDKDGDGYGMGPGCSGPDADDNDASVSTAAQAIAKYGTLKAFLAHLGYSPNNIFYMATNGNDNTGVANDPTHPFQTWAKMNLLMSQKSLKAGDMIMFRAGTWTNTTMAPTSGAAGSPIFMMAYPGELAAFDNTATGATVINLVNQSYITIDGLKVRGGGSTGSGCISGGSTDAQTSSTFHDNTFRNIEATQCGQGIILMNGVVNVTISDSIFHDSSAGGQHCIYLGARELPNANVTVQRNICYNAAWNGFHLNGRFNNLQVSQNLVYNVGIAGFSLQEGISNSFFTDNVIFGAASTGIEISNYPGDCAQFGQGGTNTICPYDQTGNLFENNTVYQTGFNPATGEVSQFPAVYVYNYSVNQVGDLGHQTFRNNIFVGYGLSGHYPSVAFRDGNKNYLATSTFANNIFWALDGAADPYVIGWGPNPSYGFQGYTCAQAPAVTTITGCINVDPLFIDVNPAYHSTPAKFNFGIQSTSPAIGAGTNVGAPVADLVGTTRANPPAIGAYEPNSSTPIGSLTVSSVWCASSSLTSGVSANCTVTLSQGAAAGGASVALSSNVQALTVPAAVSILSGSSTGTFTAVVGSIGSSQTALLTATFGGKSVSTSISLVSTTPVLNSVSCAATSLSSNASSQCTIGVSISAGAVGATVALSSSSQLLGIPATVSVPAGATTATFTATAGNIASSQSAVVTATFGGVSLTASIGLAAGVASAPLSQPGWYNLTGTVLLNVCPANNFGGINYGFKTYCHNVVDAWSGAVADTKRNRMIIWGGGHTDYSGNEVYALNLGSTPITLTRITDPSPLPPSGCPDAAPDGAPVSRHTYNNLVYLPVQDRMFSFDGGKAPCGNMSGHTWTLDFSTATPLWHAMDPVNGLNPVGYSWNAYAVCAFDPNSQTVICNDADGFLRYDPNTNTYTKLSTQHIPFSSTGVVDPVRKLMIFMGHEYQATAPLVKVVDLSAGSKFTLQDWSSQVTGCSALAGSNYPGLQYDPVLDRIVGWPGTGNTVYVFNPDTKTCTPQTFPNGPQYTALPDGTFGRFQYFPALDAFTVVNQATSDAFLLKLSAATGTPVSACDLNGDGVINSADVQIAINQTLGVTPCTGASLENNGQCTVVDVQRVINASLGGSCLTGQ